MVESNISKLAGRGKEARAQICSHEVRTDCVLSCLGPRLHDQGEFDGQISCVCCWILGC